MRTREQIINDTEPFPDSTISQLPGRGGGPPLDYVAWTHYNQRILLLHGAHRYEVTNMVFGDGTWAVAVRIFLDSDEWYDGVGEDSNPNAAESNAYKRACAHAGIGLHLYGDFWLHGRLQRDDND